MCISCHSSDVVSQTSNKVWLETYFCYQKIDNDFDATRKCYKYFQDNFTNFIAAKWYYLRHLYQYKHVIQNQRIFVRHFVAVFVWDISIFCICARICVCTQVFDSKPKLIDIAYKSNIWEQHYWYKLQTKRISVFNSNCIITYLLRNCSLVRSRAPHFEVHICISWSVHRLAKSSNSHGFWDRLLYTL